MSKKKKIKAQQLLKQKALHSQLLTPTERPALTGPEVSSSNVLAQEPIRPALPSNQIIGLKRTFISFIVIIVLFLALVVYDDRSPFLDNLGERLYYTLKLDN